ncbi:conidial pigment biosynthesis oxidase Arb2/brown2, variant 2 [Blastomyces gilchristii SLH14081]|uniref:Conidial pigment biosynthesis oxidase Arb2/brown2 n=1 Tax=Blastomyces gilchristii (strain SLH14081) TaxID=559298 RepID=A0A179U8B8_BLAGS|nr:conidial pigment biosynthesis oxidase Arb2/brown2, variant 1 [Blastomyces gilchristii SLH14081]XP_031575911.1 conidial pigment biosynthesis oxidase Arb2/brown2 [Blastomyces gilchristii SLH14081]XP_031575912.1 conidial pigment biosynthesis oxidase Arb2/brown2, variant 2 [Blastomyces gilchristii SLH14081]OAT03962.1 conidial pigment biosynthesis oxidase Arb2/brown2 [Blastomyces gilchristii SLH14081]OAT03963.1 conidial pigment biosynthesis oxidase Arb2/brown2, variant 1 [Blastomyces gilchristii 
MLLSLPLLFIWFSYLLPAISAGQCPPKYVNVRHFELELTWGDASPDGTERKVIFTNNQFPGPQLNIAEGDEVKVLVKNKLPFETSIHFHGISQHGTPWSDGVPDVTQRAIQPGESFLYRWTAVEYGAYWYHGHAHGQMSDGLFGAIVISPKPGRPAPFHKISKSPKEIEKIRKATLNPTTMFLSDWHHLTSEEFFHVATDSGIDNFCTDSVLINGKGSVICKSQDELNNLTRPDQRMLLGDENLTDKGCLPYYLPSVVGDFPFDPEKVPEDLYYNCQPNEGQREILTVDPDDDWVSLNFISSSTIARFMLSIDEHKMWIYAIDGHYIEPTRVDAAPVPNGSRVSALIKLNKPRRDYTIRAANVESNQLFSGFATLRYAGQKKGPRPKPSKPSIGYNGVNLTADFVALNEDKITPFPPSKPASKADTTFKFNIGFAGAAFRWTLSGKAPLNTSQGIEPILFDPNGPLGSNRNVTFPTKNGTWVDLVLITGGNFNPPHPIHKHSHKMYLIGKGQGPFDWETVEDAIKEVPQFFNLKSPPLVDGFTSPPGTAQDPGWVVARYQVTNPGPFLLHCHIQTHLSGGMGIILLDGYDKLPEVPVEYLKAEF